MCEGLGGTGKSERTEGTGLHSPGGRDRTWGTSGEAEPFCHIISRGPWGLCVCVPGRPLHLGMGFQSGQAITEEGVSVGVGGNPSRLPGRGII